MNFVVGSGPPSVRCVECFRCVRTAGLSDCGRMHFKATHPSQCCTVCQHISSSSGRNLTFHLALLRLSFMLCYLNMMMQVKGLLEDADSSEMKLSDSR